MKFVAGTFQDYMVLKRFLLLMAVLSLFLLEGCHRHHRPPPAAKSSATIVKRQLNADGSYYVRKGDTLYAIAFSYGLDPMDVAKKNGISSPYTIYPGQKIHLKSPAAGSGSRDSSSKVQINTVKTPGQVTTKTVQTPKASTSTNTKPAKTVAAATPGNTKETKSTTSAKKADPKSWKWPTSGRVIRGFVAGDPARNGLDIAGKEGQPVISSSAGQVVYSGNGLIGYGELIIIKHSEKMLSAYAHNRVRLVKEGDQVWSGQKIAEMGRNSSDEQILHFEIRVLGKPVNPLTYLPKN
ncbi:MAG: peptidoglycan DD-metalloendopeptidase family protein [Xanthomonadales bacterium]|nr:peptidoglycan DD-metalloendopeptidase family protein [Xanthomonadales bacterium]MDH4018354.1 peptidoglycan DD-metalloendopeptidase family protein [Xanthomonadales bacterium]